MIKTVNLEQGMPTVAEARSRLTQELARARANRTPVLKLIHGYGSSGKGGAIKQEVQRLLAEKKRQGQVYEFVPGDEFSPFSPAARRMLERCPLLSKDRDYAQCNQGVTIIVF